MIAAHAMLALEMADDRFNRRPASHLALDLRCHAPPLASGVDPEPGHLQKPWSNRRQTDSLRQAEDGGWHGWATGLF